MKKIFLILTLVSFNVFAQVEDAESLLICTGAEEYKMSSIEILRIETGLYSRIGDVEGRNYISGTVEMWGRDHYHLVSEKGDFVLLKSWTGNWNLAETSAEQNHFTELSCY